ncbi:hypothetical protein BUE64_06960 [Corynebacterium diphtheriae subsp. lausannense]|nr:hypothetical protein BUE64_06960 [Corynebacterium diphtheriae subsp. lausannense]
MAYVRDIWMKKNPDQTSRIKKVRSARWGVGKRWQAVWIENGREATKTFETESVRLFVCGGLGLQVVRESVGVSHG